MTPIRRFRRSRISSTDRQDVLPLFVAMAEGRLDDVVAAPWQPGYGD